MIFVAYQVHKICLALNPYTAMRGDLIMRSGEDGDCFFIIVQGEVKMSVIDTDSQVDVTVGVFGKGSFFGEEAVVSYYVKGQNPDFAIQRSETAMAVSDTELAFMRREEVSFRWRNPDFLFKNPDFRLKHVGFIQNRQRSTWMIMSYSR